MASLFQRGNRFYVRLYVNGKPRDIATETTNRKVAGQIKRRLEYESTSGLLETATRIRLDDLLNEFVEHLRMKLPPKSVVNDISRLRCLFGPIVPALVRRRPGKPAKAPTTLVVSNVEQITTQMLNRRLDERAREVSPKTVNEDREVLHRMFAYAIEFKGMVHPDRRTPNPAAAVKRRRIAAPIIRFLTPEQIRCQLDALSDHVVVRTAAAIMIYAGLRRSEAMWLTDCDVNLKRRLISVRAKVVGEESWQPKTARNRTVPINSDLATILGGYVPNDPWFLPSPEGSRYNPDNFSHRLAEINREHALPWTCLDFRHTFGSILAQRGVSLQKIACMMGNSPEICRRHYAALIPDELVGDAEFHDPAPFRLSCPTRESKAI